MHELVSVRDFEQAASGQLDACWDGYFAGGACDELTLRENVAAFTRLHLRPRVLTGVVAPDTTTRVLGHDLALPLIVAPLAYQQMAHRDGESGMARAAAGAGIAMCLSTLATASPTEVREAAPGAVLFHQVYVLHDRALTDEIVDEAIADGFSALFLTVDLPMPGKRERELRASWEPPSDAVYSLRRARERGSLRPGLELIDPTIDWSYVEYLCSRVDVPVVVKGILTPEDAVLAAEHGAAGVVVSNHGGRQLDGVQASIDALPAVVEAAADRLEVLLDGGIRRGTDIVKALALGARAVLAGRAPLWGLAVDGEAGAAHLLELLRAELTTALVLLGCGSATEISGEQLVPVSTTRGVR